MQLDKVVILEMIKNNLEPYNDTLNHEIPYHFESAPPYQYTKVWPKDIIKLLYDEIQRLQKPNSQCKSFRQILPTDDFRDGKWYCAGKDYEECGGCYYLKPEQ